MKLSARVRRRSTLAITIIIAFGVFITLIIILMKKELSHYIV